MLFDVFLTVHHSTELLKLVKCYVSILDETHTHAQAHAHTQRLTFHLLWYKNEAQMDSASSLR